MKKKIAIGVVCVILVIAVILILASKSSNPKNSTNIDSSLGESSTSVDSSLEESSTNIDSFLGTWGMCENSESCYAIKFNKNEDGSYTYTPYPIGTDDFISNDVENIVKSSDNEYTLTVHHDAYQDALGGYEEATYDVKVDTSKLGEKILIINDIEYKKVSGTTDYNEFIYE